MNLFTEIDRVTAAQLDATGILQEKQSKDGYQINHELRGTLAAVERRRDAILEEYPSWCYGTSATPITHDGDVFVCKISRSTLCD